ncbi:MAG TPA: glutamine-hydrolyzing carbamoyl-phosphate synthase small subunit [Acidimicrobiales bacterium]|nr:glutamine-hydrolyzing carbamoyl-phosphate synthase small subunit [Acidimicrobiales bacterium]
MSRVPSHLVLSDGTTFEGYAAGHLPSSGTTSGEFVFNTALSGYQEVITDPSYAGQIIAFTYPHIGNYGVTPLDDEASRPWCEGIVVRDLSDVPSNWRSVGSLEGFLRQHAVPAIVGVDTRRLTRHLRSKGALAGAFGHGGLASVTSAAKEARGTDDTDFVSRVTTSEIYTRGDGDLHVVALDYGIKATMVHELSRRFRLSVVPAGTNAAQIQDLHPDGVFLSNGPGDPAALGTQVSVIEGLLGTLPIFGICLGHQLLADALGGSTFKLPFGHHGSNHPVKDLSSGKIEITAQNHNYAVVPDSLTNAVVSHVNLNDGVIEGVYAERERCFSVQYHPEAGPGPHDARYLFDRFESLLRTNSLGVH